MMFRFISLALFLCLFVCGKASASVDCSGTTFDNLNQNAAYIFTGEVLDVTSIEDPYCMEDYTIRVLDSYKGRLSSNVKVRSKGTCSSISVQLKAGYQYLLFAYQRFDEPDYLFIGPCGTIFLDHANVFVNELTQINNRAVLLDDIIAHNPEKRTEALHLKAQNYLFWEYYEEAELVLKQLYTKDPENF